MIYIPSSEIEKPGLHGDEIGFTFVWKGHFLRGIYSESIMLVKSYFESGFINEVVEKKLFPKTWITDFENEQFGMIIEHELITPVVYATEWNSAMLKDAAVMVLDIAEVGWKYGYNMIDCHKMNVLFKNNRPIYVDLGSFIPRKEKCTGWLPYKTFYESYIYILDLWTRGCPQIAKRMMSPGVCLKSEDYLAWKNPLYRNFTVLLRVRLTLWEGINRLALMAQYKGGIIKRSLKYLSNTLKPSICQHISQIERKVSCVKLDSSESIISDIDLSFIKPAFSYTCINIKDHSVINELATRGG